MPAPDRETKDLAWLGDAVLALYAREWLLQQPKHPQFSRQERFLRLTRNRFLQALGEPTQVEARIGEIYKTEGLMAAYAHIEATLLPLFKKHLLNAEKGQRGRRK